jgi:hypothetical protein
MFTNPSVICEASISLIKLLFLFDGFSFSLFFEDPNKINSFHKKVYLLKTALVKSSYEDLLDK